MLTAIPPSEYIGVMPCLLSASQAEFDPGVVRVRSPRPFENDHNGTTVQPVIFAEAEERVVMRDRKELLTGWVLPEAELVCYEPPNKLYGIEVYETNTNPPLLAFALNVDRISHRVLLGIMNELVKYLSNAKYKLPHVYWVKTSKFTGHDFDYTPVVTSDMADFLLQEVIIKRNMLSAFASKALKNGADLSVDSVYEGPAQKRRRV